MYVYSIAKPSSYTHCPLATIQGTFIGYADITEEEGMRANNGLGFMKKIEEDITVPAGTFKAISWIILERVSNQDNLNDPTIYEDNNQFRVLSRTWYAKNIGIVKSVFYYGGVALKKD